LSVFLTLTLITFYFILPFSRVMSVKIDSSYPESKNEILEASDLRYYESLFGVWPRTEQISQKIKKNVSSVKSVDISYKGSKITIKAQEYPMVGYLKKGSAYYRITSVGSVSSEKLKRITGKYPVFYSFDSKKHWSKQRNSSANFHLKLDKAFQKYMRHRPKSIRRGSNCT
jgi:hypothetical protein